MLHNSYETFPNYSWSVFVVAHEFGHLFGSRHTHACVWNGNNTAIDGCGVCMESPDPDADPITCNNCPRLGVPQNGGTIMSYCHLSGNPGINFNLGFGLQPGNVIRNSVQMPTVFANVLMFTSPDPIMSAPQASSIPYRMHPRAYILPGR
jgi:hypothetical protein